MADTSTKLSTGIKQVVVPDIGDYKDVSIIEVMVKVGDTIKAEDNLVTLETDKAAMDVPSPYGGVIKEVKVKLGDKVSQGSLILLLESDSAASTSTPSPLRGEGVVLPTALKTAASVAAQNSNPSPALPLHPQGVRQWVPRYCATTLLQSGEETRHPPLTRGGLGRGWSFVQQPTPQF